MMSGRREAKFTNGWAVSPWMGKAHYFEREGAGLARSLCGIERAAGALFGEGGFPRCSRCERKAAKQ